MEFNNISFKSFISLLFLNQQFLFSKLLNYIVTIKSGMQFFFNLTASTENRLLKPKIIVFLLFPAPLIKESESVKKMSCYIIPKIEF